MKWLASLLTVLAMVSLGGCACKHDHGHGHDHAKGETKECCGTGGSCCK